VRRSRIRHCTGVAGKGEVMAFLSSKSSAFAIAAAVIGVVSLSSFAASAKPIIGPVLLKQGCPGNLVGCNPNTWTPGNHWHGGGGFGGGISINFAQPVAADEGDCYYVRRQVFIPQVGVVSRRTLVCN
jgi:hypothetical protein